MNRAPTTTTTTTTTTTNAPQNPETSNQKNQKTSPESGSLGKPSPSSGPNPNQRPRRQPAATGRGARQATSDSQQQQLAGRKSANPASSRRVGESQSARQQQQQKPKEQAARLKAGQDELPVCKSNLNSKAQSGGRKRKQENKTTMQLDTFEGSLLNEMANSLASQTINSSSCRYQQLTTTNNNAEQTNSHDEHRKQNHCEIEKRRRDKMNHYIMELASVIPSFANAKQNSTSITNNNKDNNSNNNQLKFDKLTVLRMAVQHVKSLRSSLCSFSSFHLRPSFLSSGNLLKNLILQMASQEAQDNLFMVVSCNRGKVLFVSESSKDILNQDQSELVGQCLFDLLHKDDVLKVKEQISYFNLMPKEMLVDGKTLEPIKNGRQRQSFGQLHQNHNSSSTPQPGARRSFFCRIKSSRNHPNHQQQQHPQTHLNPHHQPLLPLLGNVAPNEHQSSHQRVEQKQQPEVAREEEDEEEDEENKPICGSSETDSSSQEETGKSELDQDEEEEEEEENCRSGNSKGSSSSLSSSSGASSDGNSASNESSNSSLETGDKKTEEKKKKSSKAKSNESSGGGGGVKKLLPVVGNSVTCSGGELVNKDMGQTEDVEEEAAAGATSRADKSETLASKSSGAYQNHCSSSNRMAGSQALFSAPPRGLSKKHWRYIVMHCTGYLKKITLRADEFDEDDLDELDYNTTGEGFPFNQTADSSGDEDNNEPANATSGSRLPASEQSRTIDCLVAVCRRSPINRDLKPDRPLTFTCRYSMEGKFVFVDQRTTAALGYTPQQLLGTSHYAYCHKDSVNTFKECHRQSILNSEPVSSDIYQFKRANGQHLWLQTSLKSFRNPWTKFIDYIVANHTTAEGNQPLYQEGCVPTKFNQDMTLCGEVSGSGSQSSSPASTLSLPSMDSSCKKATSSSPSGSSIGSSYSMDSYNSATSGGIQALLQQIDRVKSGGGPARHLDLHKLHHHHHQSNHHLHHHSHHHHHHHHHHPNRAGSGGCLSSSLETGSGSGGSNSGSGSARKSNEDSGNYSDPQSCSSLFSQNSGGSAGATATSGSGVATATSGEFTSATAPATNQLPAAAVPKRASNEPQTATAGNQTNRALTTQSNRPPENNNNKQQIQTSAYFDQQFPAQTLQTSNQTGSYQPASQQYLASGEQHSATGKMSRAGAQAKSNQRAATTTGYSSATNQNQNQHYGHQFRSQHQQAQKNSAAPAAEPTAGSGSQWPNCGGGGGGRNSYSSSVASSGGSGASLSSSCKSATGRSSSEICGMPSVQARGCQSSLNRSMQQRQQQQASYANVVRTDPMPMVVSRQQQQQQQQVPMQTSQHEPDQTGSGPAPGGAAAGYTEMVPYEMATEYGSQPMGGVIQQPSQQNSMVPIQQQQRLAPMPIIWGAGRPEGGQPNAGRMAYGGGQQQAQQQQQHQSMAAAGSLCHEGPEMMALEVPGGGPGQLLAGQPAIVVHCQCLKCPSMAAMPCCQIQPGSLPPTSHQQHLQQPTQQHQLHHHQHQHQHHQQQPPPQQQSHHHQQQQHQQPQQPQQHHHQPQQQHHQHQQHQPHQHQQQQQQHHHQQQQQQQQPPPQHYMPLPNGDSDFNSINLTSLAVDGDYDEDQLLEFLAGYEPDQQLYNIQDNVYPQYNVYR